MEAADQTRPELGTPRTWSGVKMNENDIIAITGHRDYPDRAALYRGLDQVQAKHYYFGGARGTDSDALEYISRTQPGSIRTVVVPNRVIDQPASARAIIKQHATEVIELRNTGPDRYMIRNRFMVDHSTRTHAFYDYRGRGGTFNTIEYARSQNKLGRVYSLREFNFDEFRGQSPERFFETIKQMKDYKLNLSAMKMIIIQMIIEVFHKTIEAFFRMFGYIGVKSIEQFWSY